MRATVFSRPLLTVKEKNQIWVRGGGDKSHLYLATRFNNAVSPHKHFKQIDYFSGVGSDESCFIKRSGINRAMTRDRRGVKCITIYSNKNTGMYVTSPDKIGC